MHFDDRLATVLRLPVSGDGLARIQFRQLVDILGRAPADAESPAYAAAFERVEALSARIAASDRARLLRQPLQPIRNPRLISTLAAAEPEVASAAIGSAELADADWLALIPQVPVQARGILRHRRDLSPAVEALLERLGIADRGLPPAAQDAVQVQVSESEPVPDSAGEPAPPPPADDYVNEDVLELLDIVDEPPPPTSLNEWARARADRAPASPVTPPASTNPGADAGIGAIVRRIEEFRKAREANPHSEPGADAPRLPLGDMPVPAPRPAAAIDFATDAEGRITWADGPCASAVIGTSLTASEAAGEDAPAIAPALRQRLPLRAARLRLAGAPAISGEWRVDAAAVFDPAGGRFTGYCGRLRRPAVAGKSAAGAPAQADRLREVLHELRTPANAIQVAAEIIQQQLYGPAPHEYRALAASIAGDCAHILAGFEELDRLAKLEAGAMSLEPGECDLAQILARTVARLRAWTEPRRSGFAVDPASAPSFLPVGLEEDEAERLIWRLFAALAGATAPDETLSLAWSLDGGRIGVTVALPAALAARGPDDLFGTPPGERGQSLSAGMFGIGFTLRLAAAEAAAAGGALAREENLLVLRLPALTAADTGHSATGYAHS